MLICTGDLIDRETENLACISLLDQPWFYTVRSNHEEMCVKSFHDRKISDLNIRNGGEWFYQFSLKSNWKLAPSFNSYLW